MQQIPLQDDASLRLMPYFSLSTHLFRIFQDHEEAMVVDWLPSERVISVWF